MIFQKEW